jgi:hypothetical protein
MCYTFVSQIREDISVGERKKAMKVITMDRGVPVSVEEVYTGPARNAIEAVDRMFRLEFGFAGFDKPIAEIVALVREAAKEMAQIHHEQHRQAGEAGVAFQNRFFLVRWCTHAPKAHADHTEQEVLEAYRQKFGRFLVWLREKNISSKLGTAFYFDQLNGEIAACEAIVRELA